MKKKTTTTRAKPPRICEPYSNPNFLRPGAILCQARALNSRRHVWRHSCFPRCFVSARLQCRQGSSQNLMNLMMVISQANSGGSSAIWTSDHFSRSYMVRRDFAPITRPYKHNIHGVAKLSGHPFFRRIRSQRFIPDDRGGKLGEFERIWFTPSPPR